MPIEALDGRNSRLKEAPRVNRGCIENLKFSAVMGSTVALVAGPTQEIQAAGVIVFSAVILGPAAEGAIAAAKDILGRGKKRVS